MKILITGDSHTAALNRGLMELRATGQTDAAVDILVKQLGGGHLLPTPFFNDVGTHAEIADPAYRKSFGFLPPKAAHFDAIGLSMPLWPMRVVHQLVWGDLSLATRSPDRRPISHAAFRQIVLQDQRYVLQLAELLARVGVTPIAISGPGLFRDHAVLRVVTAEHVLAIFNAYRAIMIAELARRDVTIINIPAVCLDADGFMNPDFRHDDAKDHHHANAAFGALMIQAVQDWARTQS